MASGRVPKMSKAFNLDMGCSDAYLVEGFAESIRLGNEWRRPNARSTNIIILSTSTNAAQVNLALIHTPHLPSWHAKHECRLGRITHAGRIRG